MIRLKLGNLSRRVSCVFLAALLVFCSAFPAFASSGQLREVGWADTVSAFLMSCGIYPYTVDEQEQFDEWSADSLTALYNEFVDDVDSGVANVEQAVIDFLDAGKSIARLASNLVRGIIAIASGRWSVLRAFATWIIDKYSISDNQTAVQIGAVSVSAALPVYPASGAPSHSWMVSNGVSSSSNSNTRAYLASNSPNVFAGRLSQISSSGGYHTQTVFYATLKSANSVSPVLFRDFVVVGSYSLNASRVFDGVSFWFYTDGFGSANLQDVSDSYNLLPNFASVDDFLSYVILQSGVEPGFSGVTADTTSVAVPAALGDGVEFGGLAVDGVGQNATSEGLQDVIQGAVEDRQKPGVSVVPVVLSPDVDVSASGSISAPVEITPEQVPLQPSDYSAPNITGVFPFSIPWDILRILQVLNAEPVRPDFQVSLYLPVLDKQVPFHIGLEGDLAESVDSVMAGFRAMLLVLLCIGTLWLFWNNNR